jgi:hypothetical protein
MINKNVPVKGKGKKKIKKMEKLVDKIEAQISKLSTVSEDLQSLLQEAKKAA